jgi:MFS family permease
VNPEVTVDLAEVQRHTIRTLVVVQAVGAVGITIGIATASLLARDISGSESQAGFAQTAQVLGTAFAAYLLARLMSHRGRRIGLVAGYLLGAAGAVLAVVAGVVGSMVLLLVGALLLGSTSAANNSARYAATDLAEDAHKGRALSTVVWATTIGAVLGPNLTGPAGALADLLGIPVLTGPFALGAIGMVVAAVVVGVRLRPDPLLLAREVAGVAESPPTGTAWARAIVAGRERPVLFFATLGMACAHAAMVGVMIMTPLHMEHGHAELEVIGLVISLHVLGMFAFSPVVGLLADRYGRPTTLVTGAGLLLAAMVLCARSPEGSSWQIFVGLFLLGLGWSFATVSASTLIAQHAPLEARTDVQGATDLVMGLTAAAAGGLAGVVVDAWGYPALTVCSIGLVALVAIAGLGARATTRLPAADRVSP